MSTCSYRKSTVPPLLTASCLIVSATLSLIASQARAADAGLSNSPSNVNQPSPDNPKAEPKQSTPTIVEHHDLAAGTVDPDVATNAAELFTKGKLTITTRALYFSAHNAYFTKGKNQDTISYGTDVRYETAKLYGFSAGVSAFIQRGIGHSDNPKQVDTYLGPNLTGIGETYLRWEHEKFHITVGNQQIDVPFASTYDWRMVPQLFQGVLAKYGTDQNYVSAFRMTRFKSYIDNSFNQHTLYNAKVDPYSGVGDATTSGFWGAGGLHTFNLRPAVVQAQAWYFNYDDYAKLGYLQADVTANTGVVKPFGGVQYFRETSDGRHLAGEVNSSVYGAQLGIKYHSLTASLSYDFIAPRSGAYGNGALVTPYVHDVGSGPIYAQPFLSSTQDLGSGRAYAFDVNGAPLAGWFLGARYSFMDLTATPGTRSLDQSEYLVYAIHHFSGKLKGLSVTDFFGLQSSPAKTSLFLQNRLEIQYKWGSR